MEREDVIELGDASAETKGPVGHFVDASLGKAIPGLSDD